jgi:ectoine hydroxylase-related dioxygenase (phytanoyl-CoA dioxygenase family)
VAVVTDEHVKHWQEHGYVIVENLLSVEELQAARENIAAYLPDWEEYQLTPHRYRSLLGTSGWPKVEFPFVGDGLNRVTTHPELLALARRLLGTDHIILSHSNLRGKYAGTGDYEQSLHVDYSNNTLVVPKNDAEIYDLPCITYYTDVTVELGPTYIVSQQHTRDLLPRKDRFLIREGHPETYAKEVPVVLPAGSTVIYSMNTFHRGSAMRATEGVRFSHHMSFLAAGARWAGQMSFQRSGGTPEMDHFLLHATPTERELVGFPPVDDAYWNDETLEGVAIRYPDMDMTPYREAYARSAGAASRS